MYHVFSDLPGAEGTTQLIAFVRRFGLRMLAAGARQATNREVGELLARKKRHMAERGSTPEDAEDRN